MSEQDVDILRADFEGTAEWRRRKVELYPDNNRNIEAAVMLDRLAETASHVPHDILRAYNELFEDFTEFESHSERLRRVGFSYFPSSAEEFVRDGIAEFTGGKS